MIKKVTRNFIRAKAREFSISVWRRYQSEADSPTIDGFFEYRLEFAFEVAGITVEKPELIPSDRPGFEVAGVMNRQHRLIAIAQKYPIEYRNFTAAHELGHWHLHPDLSYHRDRPLQGGERANSSREIVEQEADLFASEFLMPEKEMRRRFAAAFGGPITMSHPNLGLLAADDAALARLRSERRLRSLTVAKVPSFGGNPLHRQFGVSLMAMAIQLEDLGLVA